MSNRGFFYQDIKKTTNETSNHVAHDVQNPDAIITVILKGRRPSSDILPQKTANELWIDTIVQEKLPIGTLSRIERTFDDNNEYFYAQYDFNPPIKSISVHIYSDLVYSMIVLESQSSSYIPLTDEGFVPVHVEEVG